MRAFAFFALLLVLVSAQDAPRDRDGRNTEREMDEEMGKDMDMDMMDMDMKMKMMMNWMMEMGKMMGYGGDECMDDEMMMKGMMSPNMLMKMSEMLMKGMNMMKKEEMMEKNMRCMMRDIPGMIANAMNMPMMNFMVLQLETANPTPFCGAKIPLSYCPSMMDMMEEEEEGELENNPTNPADMIRQAPFYVMCIKNARPTIYDTLQPRNIYMVQPTMEQRVVGDDIAIDLVIPAVAQPCVGFIIATPANVAAGKPQFVSADEDNTLLEAIQNRFDGFREASERVIDANCQLSTIAAQMDEEYLYYKAKEMIEEKTAEMEEKMEEEMPEMPEGEGEMEMDMDAVLMKLRTQMKKSSYSYKIKKETEKYIAMAVQMARETIISTLLEEMAAKSPSMFERVAMLLADVSQSASCDENGEAMNVMGTAAAIRDSLMIPDLTRNVAVERTIFEMSCKVWKYNDVKLVQTPCMMRPKNMMMRMEMDDDEEMPMSMEAAQERARGRQQGLADELRGRLAEGMKSRMMGGGMSMMKEMMECGFLNFGTDMKKMMEQNMAKMESEMQANMKMMKLKMEEMAMSGEECSFDMVTEMLPEQVKKAVYKMLEEDPRAVADVLALAAEAAGCADLDQDACKASKVCKVNKDDECVAK